MKKTFTRASVATLVLALFASGAALAQSGTTATPGVDANTSGSLDNFSPTAAGSAASEPSRDKESNKKQKAKSSKRTNDSDPKDPHQVNGRSDNAPSSGTSSSGATSR